MASMAIRGERLIARPIALRRGADGNSTLRSVGGSNAGPPITQVFEAMGPDRMRVRTTVEMHPKGMLRLLAPPVRMGVRGGLATALEEDHVDLEERGYPNIRDREGEPHAQR